MSETLRLPRRCQARLVRSLVGLTLAWLCNQCAVSAPPSERCRAFLTALSGDWIALNCVDSGLSEFPKTDQHLDAELFDRYTIALIASDYLVILRHKTERYAYDKDGIVTGGLNQHSYGFITFDENIGVLSYFGLWGSNHKTNKGAFLGRVEGSYCTGEMIETEDGVLWYRREGAKPGRLESKWILRRDGKLAMYLYGVKYDGLPKEEWTLRFLLRRIQPGSSDSSRSTLKR